MSELGQKLTPANADAMSAMGQEAEVHVFAQPIRRPERATDALLLRYERSGFDGNRRE